MKPLKPWQLIVKYLLYVAIMWGIFYVVLRYAGLVCFC